MKKRKIIRIVTIPKSFDLFKGQMNFMKDSFDFVGVSSSGDNIPIVEEREGIKVKSIQLTRTISPIKDFLALLKLVALLRKEKPDIVHTHTPKAGTIGMLAAYLSGIKHRVHTVAGMPLMEVKGLKRLLLDNVEKITYACATLVLPNSENLKKFILTNNYVGANKLNVIGNGSTNGIDTDFFSKENISENIILEIRNKYKISENDFVFLSVGRIVKDKGIVELVKAFKKFNNLYPNSKLLMLGNFEKELDPLPGEIENEINNNASIVYCGYQNDVRSFFVLSDIFVFPSYREGFPNVVMQAGSMGIPSIVTNINGSNEIIKDGVNGYIVPVKKVEDIYEKMEVFYNDKETLEYMKDRCRYQILSRYEQKNVWNDMLKMYKEL